MLPKPDISQFQELVVAYFTSHQRQLPWRQPESSASFDAYKILVSEMMLQQTQVTRAIPKYAFFLEQFPTIERLATASLGQVLTAWSGLGYNRRAKYLHEAAIELVRKTQPWAYTDLVACKGIGPNTAAAICVYAYNQPLVFIETNIRTVFIHHFFTGKSEVDDKAIVPVLGQALAGQDPRMFYWALMDYAAHLKTTAGNITRRSKHYARQATFTGSRRQLRGQTIHLLTTRPHRRQELEQLLDDERAQSILAELVQEGLLGSDGDSYHLA